MPGWIIVIVAIWVVIAAVAVGALRERRRGLRGAPDPEYTQARAEEDMRMHGRGQQGSMGGF